MPFQPAPRFRGLPWGILALAFLLTTGCVNLEPRQTNIRYYVLTGVDRPSGDAPADTARGTSPAPDAGAQLALGLRRVRLASYLDTPTIVTRMGPHEVHFGEFHRWGEDLPQAINRTLARYLVARPRVGRVDVVPWPDRTRHGYVIQLHVYRFEGEAPPGPTDDGEEPDFGLRQVGEPGTVHVAAAWEVIDPAGETVVHQGRTSRRIDGWTVGDYAGLVRALDTALDGLAADIAAALPCEGGAC
jgi:uncharacterized lipoprotein YmbA